MEKNLFGGTRKELYLVPRGDHLANPTVGQKRVPPIREVVKPSPHPRPGRGQTFMRKQACPQACLVC